MDTDMLLRKAGYENMHRIWKKSESSDPDGLNDENGRSPHECRNTGMNTSGTLNLRM
ncbi:MAG: hypothetical protein V2I97_21315 [Desulfococcaceae bacterium]|jgi:hypothetical protein|nr:hypothetical protein [Desulfococcaceae bacterium]